LKIGHEFKSVKKFKTAKIVNRFNDLRELGNRQPFPWPGSPE
jgi:hypothetical protein